MKFEPTPRQPASDLQGPATQPTFSWAHLLIKMTSRKFLVTVGVVVGCLAKVLTGKDNPGDVERFVQIFCVAGAIVAPVVYVLLEGLIDRKRRDQYLTEHNVDPNPQLDPETRRQLLNHLGLEDDDENTEPHLPQTWDRKP